MQNYGFTLGKENNEHQVVRSHTSKMSEYAEHVDP